MRWIIGSLSTLLGAALLYLLLWPVPIEPQAWQAPENPGYTGPFKSNRRLQPVERLQLAGFHGPEDIAVDEQGRLYAPVTEGVILRLEGDGSQQTVWAETGGRPLGIEFDAAGNLIVADAFRGLLSIARDGSVTTLATEADGIPIRYADDLDVAADGRIYFSDASVKFGAEEYGGTYPASLLDLMEHGGHGRLLVHDPASGETHSLIDGLEFANGVVVSPDGEFVLVNETGRYRILKHWLSGPRQGETEVLIDRLPGFPDNLNPGTGGRYWLALISPRNALLDAMADKPFLRKVVQRLPAFLRPEATAYGHVIAFDGEGRVLLDLQDPAGHYPLNTSAVEAGGHLYLGSLTERAIGRIPLDRLSP